MTTRKAQRYALPGDGPTDEDLRHEIELTRAELGDTAAELLRRADVKSRLREAAQRRVAVLHNAMDTTLDTARRHRVAVIAGTVTMLVLMVLLKIKH